MKKTVKTITLVIAAIIIFASISGCAAHQKSQDSVIRDFKNNIDSFEAVAQYICNYDLSEYRNLSYVDEPVYIDFAVSDFTVMHKEVMAVSSGKLFYKEVTPDKLTIERVKEIFDLGYACIEKIGIDSDTPVVIYFRIDDVKDPENDKPHGIAYTSDNLPPSIANGDRIPSYTEKITDNWYYYEKDALSEEAD